MCLKQFEVKPSNAKREEREINKTIEKLKNH